MRILSIIKKCTSVIVIILVIGLNCNAQNTKLTTESHLLKIDSLLRICNKLLVQREINETDSFSKIRYKLYATENMYTFLQLNTETGQIEQIQWSMDSENEGGFTINSDDLTFGKNYGTNRFELYPTQNMYQFILLDKTNGRKWHVQWGIGDKKRWIRRIY